MQNSFIWQNTREKRDGEKIVSCSVNNKHSLLFNYNNTTQYKTKALRHLLMFVNARINDR